MTGRGPPGVRRRRLGGGVFVLPGVVWLAAFFLVPLVAILIVSFGTSDATGHITFAPDPRQLRPGGPPGVRAGVLELAALRGDHDGPVDRHRLSDRVLDLALRRPPQGPARHPVMLPFWTSYLIRTYAWMIILRDNGVLNSILQAVGSG